MGHPGFDPRWDHQERRTRFCFIALFYCVSILYLVISAVVCIISIFLVLCLGFCCYCHAYCLYSFVCVCYVYLGLCVKLSFLIFGSSYIHYRVGFVFPLILSYFIYFDGLPSAGMFIIVTYSYCIELYNIFVSCNLFWFKVFFCSVLLWPLPLLWLLFKRNFFFPFFYFQSVFNFWI